MYGWDMWSCYVCLSDMHKCTCTVRLGWHPAFSCHWQSLCICYQNCLPEARRKPIYVRSISFIFCDWKSSLFFHFDSEIRNLNMFLVNYTYVYVHFGMILLIDKLQSAASVLANSRILLFPCQLIIFDVDLSSQIANWMLERNRSGSKLPLICKCYVYITSIDGVRRMEYDIPRNGWI